MANTNATKKLTKEDREPVFVVNDENREALGQKCPPLQLTVTREVNGNEVQITVDFTECPVQAVMEYAASMVVYKALNNTRVYADTKEDDAARRWARQREWKQSGYTYQMRTWQEWAPGGWQAIGGTRAQQKPLAQRVGEVVGYILPKVIAGTAQAGEKRQLRELLAELQLKPEVYGLTEDQLR
jgi:hypothetical protein